MLNCAAIPESLLESELSALKRRVHRRDKKKWANRAGDKARYFSTRSAEMSLSLQA
jgi:transcriptional regulator of aromatic amino acid metabolism